MQFAKWLCMRPFTWWILSIAVQNGKISIAYATLANLVTGSHWIYGMADVWNFNLYVKILGTYNSIIHSPCRISSQFSSVMTLRWFLLARADCDLSKRAKITEHKRKWIAESHCVMLLLIVNIVRNGMLILSATFYKLPLALMLHPPLADTFSQFRAFCCDYHRNFNLTRTDMRNTELERTSSTKYQTYYNVAVDSGKN